MAESVRAWLLDVGLEHRIAIGAHELVEALPEVFLDGAHGTVPWRDREIPIINLAALAGTEGKHQGPAVVAAWQTEPGAPLHHGALCLMRLPNPIHVDDAMACDLPDAPHWQSLAISCFEFENAPVPVIDVSRVFENL
jgi:hypothetical protein